MDNITVVYHSSVTVPLTVASCNPVPVQVPVSLLMKSKWNVSQHEPTMSAKLNGWPWVFV